MSEAESGGWELQEVTGRGLVGWGSRLLDSDG